MGKHKNWMSVYDAKSLTPEIERLIANAATLQKRDKEEGVGRDVGSCVLGAGIAIEFREYKKRNSVTKVVISQAFQGNVGSYQVAKNALKYLQDNGVNAFWYDGIMD